MDATETPATTRPFHRPAVLRCDGEGRPVYRRGLAPDGLATAAQLRADRLSPAGLAPVAWLYYACIGHRICPLYDRAQARPIRPLTERQREVLAEGRKLANTVPCKRCAQVRVSVWGEHHCGPCGQAVEAERYAAWERRMHEEAEALERMVAEDRAKAAAWASSALADPALVVLDTVIRAGRCLSVGPTCSGLVVRPVRRRRFSTGRVRQPDFEREPGSASDRRHRPVGFGGSTASWSSVAQVSHVLPLRSVNRIMYCHRPVFGMAGAVTMNSCVGSATTSAAMS